MFSPAIQACLSITTAPETPAGISEDFTSCVTGVGEEWANITNSLTCSGGTGHGTAESTTVAYHQTPVGSNDHWVAGTIYYDQTVDGSGLILGSNGTEYYFAYIRNGALIITEDSGYFEAYSAGGYAQGSYSLAVQIGTSGGHATFSAWLNGSPVSLTGGTDTNDRVTRGQYVGVYIRRTTATNYDSTVDNLTAGTGTYTP